MIKRTLIALAVIFLLMPASLYARSNFVFISRVTPLFYNVGDADYVGVLSPNQAVEVLDEYGSWRKVVTPYGPRWMNLHFSPPVAGLDSFFRRFGSNIAIFYKNLETGFIYMYNPDRMFFGASVPKLNHALYIYTLAERGYISLDTVRTFTRADYWGGTGVMRHMPFGGYFTTRELLGHSIRDSDNVAFRMLVREYYDMPFTYRDFVWELGANLSLVRDVISQNTTARDAGIWAVALHEYLQSDGRYSELLKEDLKDTSVRFIHADYPIAQKYGWYHRHFHDMAIVYADSPYILIILSNMGVEGGAHRYNLHTGTHDIFYEISGVIQEFNRRWF